MLFNCYISFNYCSIVAFLLVVVQLLFLNYCCFFLKLLINFIFLFFEIVLLATYGPDHTNYFSILQPLEGNNLFNRHLRDYCLARVYTFAYCWAHVVKPRFTPMYLCIFAQRLAWKSWRKGSPISNSSSWSPSYNELCSNTSFNNFLSLPFIIEPNIVVRLVYLFSFLFFLPTLISSTNAFCIVFFLKMFRYLKLVTTCD